MVRPNPYSTLAPVIINSRRIPPHIKCLPPASIPTMILLQHPEPGVKTTYWEAKLLGHKPTIRNGKTQRDIIEHSAGFSDGFLNWRLPLSVAGQLNISLLHWHHIPQLNVTEASYFDEFDWKLHGEIRQPAIRKFVKGHLQGERGHLIIPTHWYFTHQTFLSLSHLLDQVPFLTFSVASNNCINSLLNKRWIYQAQKLRHYAPYRLINKHFANC